MGNLLFEATGEDVKKLFEGFGNVASVVIAMEKQKKAPKSRGFGFVQMPDEQQAFAAIAALNGKEFMGRVLNVNPARPKTEAPRKSELKKRIQPKPEAGARQYSQEEAEQKKTWYSPVFNRHPALNDKRVRPSGQPGTYKNGRRTRSYINRQGLAGIQIENKPRHKNQDNPMRWRKRTDKPKPWQKKPGEHKLWTKTEGGARPWKKAEGEPNPRKKPAGDARPWSKNSGRPQKSRFNRLTSRGMVRRGNERSHARKFS